MWFQSKTGVSGWTTPSELVAQALGWVIVTDPSIGAKGDGKTDCTAAVQAAFNAAAVKGKTVYFPAGDYLISDTIKVDTRNSLEVAGAKSGVRNGWNTHGGAFLVWGGASGGKMVLISQAENVSWSGVGFHGQKLAKALCFWAANDPMSSITPKTETVQVGRFRDFHIYRATTGVELNDAGDNSQCDKLLFESVRMEECVTYGFYANSMNVTTIRFSRCATAAADPDGGFIHYMLVKCAMMKIEDCNGAYGQDFVRVGASAHTVIVDNSQHEGGANPDRAFVRIGSGSTETMDTTIIRGCVIDNPCIVQGYGRRVLSEGNLWHTAGNAPGGNASIVLAGNDVRWTSLAEPSAPTPTVSGVNALFRVLDSDTPRGAPTPGTASGTGASSVSITGSVFRGQVAFTTGSNMGANGEAIAITGVPLGPKMVPVISPANAAAAAAGAYVGTIGSVQWGINLASPPSAATRMVFNYTLG